MTKNHNDYIKYLEKVRKRIRKDKRYLFIYSSFTSICGLAAMTDGPNLVLMWLAPARYKLRPPDCIYRLIRS